MLTETERRDHGERWVPGNGVDVPDEWEPLPEPWQCEPEWMDEAMDAALEDEALEGVHHG